MVAGCVSDRMHACMLPRCAILFLCASSMYTFQILFCFNCFYSFRFVLLERQTIFFVAIDYSEVLKFRYYIIIFCLLRSHCMCDRLYNFTPSTPTRIQENFFCVDEGSFI
jgi:hypothetical protein